MKNISWIAFTLVVIVAISIATPSRASSFASKTVDMTKPIIALGIASCCLNGGAEGLNQAARTSEAVFTSVEIARLIKRGTDSGLPSGHAAGAFALATSLSDHHPKLKWLYYAGAAIIGWSTVRNGDHSWSEVAAGALLGTTIGRESIKRPNGLLVGRVIRF